MDAILLTSDTGGDLALEPGDLVQDRGLQSAVLLSLFTNARDDQADPGTDPQGWWGDTDGDEWGSLLWQLQRAKLTEELIERARQSAEASLQWLLEDGIASQIDVAAERYELNGLALSVRIHRGNAPEWAHLWDELEGTFSWEGGTLRLSAA
ncbi:MAG: phage GP46 family protein [Planctomycetota bacterium]